VFELPPNTNKSELYITDVYGAIIAKINIPVQQAQLQWDCKDISSGIYFYQTEIEGRYYKGKIIIQK
jgi:hypothetical protein